MKQAYDYWQNQPDLNCVCVVFVLIRFEISRSNSLLFFVFCDLLWFRRLCCANPANSSRRSFFSLKFLSFLDQISGARIQICGAPPISHTTRHTHSQKHREGRKKKKKSQQNQPRSVCSTGLSSSRVWSHSGIRRKRRRTDNTLGRSVCVFLFATNALVCPGKWCDASGNGLSVVSLRFGGMVQTRHPRNTWTCLLTSEGVYPSLSTGVTPINRDDILLRKSAKTRISSQNTLDCRLERHEKDRGSTPAAGTFSRHHAKTHPNRAQSPPLHPGARMQQKRGMRPACTRTTKTDQNHCK